MKNQDLQVLSKIIEAALGGSNLSITFLTTLPFSRQQTNLNPGDLAEWMPLILIKGRESKKKI